MKKVHNTAKVYSDAEQRKSHILNLVLLAQADGKWHENEKRFIADVARRIGLTDQEHEELLFNPDSVKFVVAQSEEERVTLLYDLLFMMKMDGGVSPAEETICLEIGLRMGFNPLMIQEMINVMKTYLFKRVPDDSLINILRKYLN